MAAASAADARTRRVASLYDEVINRTIESLRADVRAEGLDESVLEELKRVRTIKTPRTEKYLRPPRLREPSLCVALSVDAGVRMRALTQRTYQKLRDTGTLAGGAADAADAAAALAPPAEEKKERKKNPCRYSRERGGGNFFIVEKLST